MIVGVDASAAAKAQRTGTEWYAVEIIRSLLTIDKSNSYRLYSKLPIPDDLKGFKAQAEWRFMPFPAGWTLLRLPWELMRRPPDVLFVPSNRLPIYVPTRSVVMVHDLSYRHVPEAYTALQRAQQSSAVEWAKRYATFILSPSEFTAKSLRDEIGIDEQRIVTVHHGCTITDGALAGAKLTTRPIEEPYFFYVGRIEQKKNIVRMMRAFVEFRRQHKSSFKLVLAGKPGLGYTEIVNARAELGDAKDDVLFTGYLSSGDINRHMYHAQGFVFLSLFEGFGMPLLEAFALEVPVIAANATCLPEIAGGAALLVDPYDVDEIASSMRAIVDNESLRVELVHRGTRRASEFSWTRAARQTLNSLEKAVS